MSKQKIEKFSYNLYNSIGNSINKCNSAKRLTQYNIKAMQDEIYNSVLCLKDKIYNLVKEDYYKQDVINSMVNSNITLSSEQMAAIIEQISDNLDNSDDIAQTRNILIQSAIDNVINLEDSYE